MNINEINKYKWKISPKFEIRKIRTYFIEAYEQECHFNVLKKNEQGNKEILVCCSFQEYINQLRDSEFFLLEDALISTIPRFEGFILQVRGTMSIKGLSLRKKIRHYSEEEKKVLSDRAKLNLIRKH